MKHCYTLFLKTGPACNAGCISCPSGRKQKGDIEPIPMMSLKMFKAIVDRVQEQGHILSVILHYLNEPTMNPHLPDIVAHARGRKIFMNMSTNGSYPDNLKMCMAAGLDSLIFSVSGWTQPVHERSHKGTNIEQIKDSMRYTSAHLQPHQWVRVGWHDYLYNRHEAASMAKFCQELGFKFQSYQTSVLPIEIVIDRFKELDLAGNLPELPAERDIILKLPRAKQMCMDRKHFTCVVQQRMFAIDGNGYIYNCCAKGNAKGNRRESVFDIQLEDFQKRRFTDPDCLDCKSVGGHVYATQKQATPMNLRWNTYRWLEDRYRALGLGRFRPLMSRMVRLYERPQNTEK